MESNRLPGYAREQILRTLTRQPLLTARQLVSWDPDLAEAGACFVTLTLGGALRGCIGSLMAHQPLAEDLLQNAVAAALRDPRFPPVTEGELADIQVEISLLSTPSRLAFDTPEDLLAKLRPGLDGVILSREGRRATFLPQVWATLPDAETFLQHLCVKAGMTAGCWKQSGLMVQIYTVQKITEGTPSRGCSL